MKTLYKIAIALGLTEWTYSIIAIMNKVDLQSVVLITILGITGFSCFYIQWSKDNSKESSDALVLEGEE